MESFAMYLASSLHIIISLSVLLAPLFYSLHQNLHSTQGNMEAGNDSPICRMKMRRPTKCSAAVRLCVDLFCLRKETFEETPKPTLISL